MLHGVKALKAGKAEHHPLYIHILPHCICCFLNSALSRRILHLSLPSCDNFLQLISEVLGQSLCVASFCTGFNSSVLHSVEFFESEFQHLGTPWRNLFFFLLCLPGLVDNESIAECAVYQMQHHLLWDFTVFLKIQ